MGYYGCFLISAFGTFLALLYLIIYVNEPTIQKQNNNLASFQEYFKTFGIEPFKKMIKHLIKKRSGHLRLLLILLIFNYGLISFNNQVQVQEYLYMLKHFKTFGEDQFAYYRDFFYNFPPPRPRRPTS